MKSKHRAASHAKRRWQADPGAIYKLMNKLQPFTPAELVALELPIRVSFEALRTGPGISDVELGIDLHEQLCRLSTPAQMLDAMRQVLAIRASNQPQERRAA